MLFILGTWYLYLGVLRLRMGEVCSKRTSVLVNVQAFPIFVWSPEMASGLTLVVRPQPTMGLKTIATRDWHNFLFWSLHLNQCMKHQPLFFTGNKNGRSRCFSVSGRVILTNDRWWVMMFTLPEVSNRSLCCASLIKGHPLGCRSSWHTEQKCIERQPNLSKKYWFPHQNRSTRTNRN